MIEANIHTVTFWTVLLASMPPLAAFAAILIFFRGRPKVSAGLSIGAIGLSLLAAAFLLMRYWNMTAPLSHTGQWVCSGDLSISVGFLLDPLNMLMLAVVSTISFLVQVYSLGYMHGDPGFSRYYAYMSLFAWAMICLVLSPTLVQLYIFWELVGLSSYLLIGFWHEKFSASQAGKKAFVMTRLGDVFFLMGILLLLTHIGSPDILLLDKGTPVAGLTPMVAAVGAMLIFGGIIGKSAQFPLMTWLPDAMEGPTPVSALLHSATMVAAGVFLLARLFPFFSQSPSAMMLCLSVGTVSMLMAGTSAIVSRDIKQVLAYSTISQLGFMIMGLAAGGYEAGVFHLTTHAGFKALLFLCAGVLIHRHHTNDIFEIGAKNGRGLSPTIAALFIGGGALSGIWPFSGFFSKEMIMAELAALHNPIWLLAGLAGAFLTAYYTFRMIFIVAFSSASPGATEADHTPLRSVMVGVLGILSAITLVLGFFQDGLRDFLIGGRLAVGTANHGHSPVLLMTALGISVSGVLLAWFEFGRRAAPKTGFVERFPALADFFAQRWYLDRFYRRFIDVVIYRGISFYCTQNDNKIIDGGVHRLAQAAVGVGRRAANWHEALIQARLWVMVGVVLVLLAFFVYQVAI
ncbi:MAG: NADH-quinone oxidoreductase subunit L [Deltaproteobacteria bacterium]|nr:NADH-quinone oxidoreductase subunit L [Deltaproteobacteria bacterium]